MSIAVVTDSTAYLSPEEREKYNIYMIPLSVTLEDGVFEEEVEIHAKEFYDKVREAKVFPKTTQPPIGKFMELFETLSKDYDEVICIHLSSGISGTFQSALQAGNIIEGIKVHGFDSEISCAPQGYYAVQAAKMAKEGKTSDEILEKLEEIKSRMRAYFIVDDLSHLQRGGRLSSAAAIVGGLLQIKPVLHFENKVIVPFEKIRTKKKALSRVEELLSQDAAKYDRIHAMVIHANREQEALEWMAKMQEKFPNVEFHLSYFGPVIGTHLGEGSLGLGWVPVMEE
ncbi:MULTISPECIES: DegV family protein [Ureibacillus]|jgi:DegV family protein with EDD domain|uniref:DegV family protein with EDD domain n=1 Tax=Ureibacillus thermosphaericus TaxID=51173 RepID=A0A840PYH9_URETH|nr:DegV family protein [Ureibacillus thermosphaericus]MBB5149712.1 DegV family protein with EDD domain [Ureibacillus thermosphaericus]NKZ32653.1 DegV family protein [Ureibacillus thermosphaericus]